MADDRDYSIDHCNRIGRLEKETDDIDKRVTECEKKDAVMWERITLSLDNLSKIPDAMTSLRDGMISLDHRMTSVQSEVSNVKDEVENVRAKINQIDAESHFNIRLWFKNNWMMLSVGLLAITAWATILIKKFGEAFSWL